MMYLSSRATTAGAGIFLLVSFLVQFCQAGAIPEAPSVERYSPLWEKSPFTLAYVVEPPPQVSFADQLVIAAMSAIGEQIFVTIVDKQTQERQVVSINENKYGIRLVSTAPDNNPLRASAVVQKGNETATVRYDVQLLTANSASAAPPSTMVANVSGEQTSQPLSNKPKDKTNRLREASSSVRRRIVVPRSPTQFRQ